MAFDPLLGFFAGLPHYMFSTILSARLAKHDVDIAQLPTPRCPANAASRS